MNRYKRFYFFFLFLSILTFSSLVKADPINNLSDLIQQKRYQEAFDIGLGHQELIGNPEFDYYFAIAAIDSAHPALGIVTLERLLTLYPENDQARLELARGYFLSGNYEKAKIEFNKILQKNIPDSLKYTIFKYLDDIKQHDPVSRTVKNGYLNVSVGESSNVITETLGANDSSWLYQVVDPFYTSLINGPQSSYFDTNAGYLISGHMVGSLRYLVQLDGSYRNYTALSSFDQRSTSSTLGIEKLDNANQYSFITNIRQDGLNGGDLRTVYSIKSGWNKNISNNTTLKSSISYSMLRYNNNFAPIYNTNMPAIAIGASQWVGGAHGFKFDLEMNAAQEKNIESQNFLSRNIIGGKLGVASILTTNLTSYLSAGYYKSNYWNSQVNPLFSNQIRQDRLLALALSLKLKLDRSFSLIGNLSRLSNNSEFPTSVFMQQELNVGVNYNW